MVGTRGSAFVGVLRDDPLQGGRGWAGILPVGLLLVLLVALPLAAQTRSDASESGRAGHALGNSNAPVTVVEYADFACAACADFAVDTWPRVRRELVESGRVYWRVVPFSLGFRHGARAARAGECAAMQDGFWPMHDALFAERERWMKPRRPEDTFEEIGAASGLDPDALRRCMDDDVPHDRMERAREEAQAAGVRATPTFLVNGRPVLGALPFETFLQAVEAAEAGGNSPRR